MASPAGSPAQVEATSPSCGIAAAAVEVLSLASPTGDPAKAEAEDVRSTGSAGGGGTLGPVAEGAGGALLVAPWITATAWRRTAETMIRAVSYSSSSQALEACWACPCLSAIAIVLCSLAMGGSDGFDSSDSGVGEGPVEPSSSQAGADGGLVGLLSAGAVVRGVPRHSSPGPSAREAADGSVSDDPREVLVGGSDS